MRKILGQYHTKLVHKIHRQIFRQMAYKVARRSLCGIALTISCLSFGRFYAIYTITAPNAAATAYVRQCKTGNFLLYCRFSACHLLIPPSNFPKMIRIHIAGNALPRWLNHSCFPPSASFCPWSGHEKSSSGEMLSIVFGFTSQNMRYFSYRQSYTKCVL